MSKQRKTDPRPKHGEAEGRPIPSVPAVPAPGRNWLRQLGHNARNFAGLDGAPPDLWVRWLVLRAVGLVYVVVFAGIIVEGQAILGPTGLVPAGGLFRELASTPPLAAFFKAPTLFWLNSGAPMITALGWLGCLAALALVVNLWPRVALGICWLTFVSFVVAWGEFTPAQVDNLMLETGLLCIPFAPAGLRPGLGAHSPPRPIAVFMMRWLLFRVMFESGVVKLVSADSRWRELTAMDIMYETAPSPTVLGYWLHQLPHPYHVFEIAFTFLAEFVAPLLAVLGGRRGRWLAFVVWTIFQVGIQLTCNFGWLNTAAIGLGILLLDDQMIARAAARLGRTISIPASTVTSSPLWARRGLRVFLGTHFALTLYYFALTCGVSEAAIPSPINTAAKSVSELRSANRYYLYANLHPAHLMVDFEGSNDGGRTWRTYLYRHFPQRVDRAPPFTAPWFPRFENTMFFESPVQGRPSVVPATAVKLLRREPEIIALFASDPFPDRPPTVVRMRRYRLLFTDPATLRRTGHYWRKEFAGDYLPALHRSESGEIAPFDLAAGDAAMAAGNFAAARAIFEQQYALGNLDAGYRLADIFARGLGVPPQPAKVFALFSELAERGETRAWHSVGLCYEHGVGVPLDYQKAAAAYQRAADDGNLLAMAARGSLSARDLISPRDDVEGLSWLFTAATRAIGDDPLAQVIRRQEPATAARLMERMTPAQIAEARARAATRH